MSRTIITLESTNPAREEQIIREILAMNDYEEKLKNNERYFQNGVGLLVAPKFIKYSFNGDKLILEGWVKNFAIMGESKLDGAMGAVPKRSCKAVLDTMIQSIGNKMISYY